MGLIEAREDYPTDMGVTRLPMQTRWDYTWRYRILWRLKKNCSGNSCIRRELRLNTYLESGTNVARGPVWSAPNYLLLLSMAVQGFGWCALPCALVEEFAAENHWFN